MLEAIAFIHEAGYAHGGIVIQSNFSCQELTLADFSIRNVAFTSCRLSRATEKELFQRLGNPQSNNRPKDNDGEYTVSLLALAFMAYKIS